MPVSNANKVVSNSNISCTGVTSVTLSFDAGPDLKANPTDVVLIMDTSSSLNGTKFTKAKAAAKNFIDIFTEATGGTIDGSIENNSRMALVSFSTTAFVNSDFITNSFTLKKKIDGLTASGRTNHFDAFTKAKELLASATANKKAVILFTDGAYNEGGNPDALAEEIKALGAEFYCVGLLSDAVNINKWATDPDDIYVAHSDDVNRLNEMFEKIAYEVILAGAHDIVIEEKLNPDFKIVKINPPSTGVASAKDAHSLTWEMDGAGRKDNENISLTFDIMHVGATGGTKKVNESVTYTDRENQTLTFPSPEVTVDCAGPIVNPEGCPQPIAFTAQPCKDMVTVDVPEAVLSSLGRIVRVDAVLKNICPNKKVAAAIFLTETDKLGVEKPRGMKTVMVPPQSGTACQDVAIKCINFVVPEEGGTICAERNFNVRVMANYVDTDFQCCDGETVIV